MLTLAGKPITQNGLGLMRLTMPQYRLPDPETFKVLRAALAANVNVWNAADYYGTTESNSLHLLNRYFAAYPEDAEKVVLSVKAGLVDRANLRTDCSREGLRKAADNALVILDGKKKIDVFGLARVDPEVAVEDSVAALMELRDQGKINGIQLSEVRPETIRRAACVAKIDMVEAEASLWSPMVFEAGVAKTCAELGIVLVAHTPLGFGALSGALKSLDDLSQDSPLRHLPRYQPDVFANNVKFVEAVARLAAVKGCTTAQLALNWLKAQSRRKGMPTVVPVAGARSEERVRENAVMVDLNAADLEELQRIIREYPIKGYRTMEVMARLNEY